MDAIEAEKAKFSLLLIHPLIGIFISGGGVKGTYRILRPTQGYTHPPLKIDLE